MKVIISNGHFKFILGAVAAELHKRGMLSVFITAGYPTPGIKFIIEVLANRSKGLLRLLDRKEDVPNELVFTVWLSEFVQKLGNFLFRSGSDKNYLMYGFSLWLYSRYARCLINQAEADIYHYRAGYGLQSVVAAKQKGMVTICDHSLVHPRVLDYLIKNGGSLPLKTYTPEITRFWASVESDINQADFVIVNSDFVKDTFINRGWDEDRIFVAYTGLDDALINSKPVRGHMEKDSECLNFQFAGEGCSRKGLPHLLCAFKEISHLPWSLRIIGNINQDVLDEFVEFLGDKRIKLIPFCSRYDLLVEMGSADVFIFPSLAEGSARVIFMAMAMGCYVITTPNSGSVVINGVSGTIVAPGDVKNLRNAIEDAFTKRIKIKKIGAKNSDLIQFKYNQLNYGSRIVEIYHSIIKLSKL